MLTLTTAQITAWIGDLFWPFVRVAMVFSVAPMFSGRLVPVRIRLVLALVITWLLLPVIPPAPAVEPFSAAGVLIIVQQLLIGVLLGFTLQMVFGAMVVGGQMLAMSMGLGFASMVDPQNGVQSTVVGQYYVALAALLFFALNGHLALIGVLADSFHSLPLDGSGVGPQGLWAVAGFAGRMFAGGVLVALPAVASLLLANMTFGVITRAAPQLNIFGVGFPLVMTLGFVVMMFSLPVLLPQFSGLMTDALSLLQGLGG